MTRAPTTEQCQQNASELKYESGEIYRVHTNLSTRCRRNIDEDLRAACHRELLLKKTSSADRNTVVAAAKFKPKLAYAEQCTSDNFASAESKTGDQQQNCRGCSSDKARAAEITYYPRGGGSRQRRM
jgi:hypothetical protein